MLDKTRKTCTYIACNTPDPTNKARRHHPTRLLSCYCTVSTAVYTVKQMKILCPNDAVDITRLRYCTNLGQEVISRHGRLVHALRNHRTRTSTSTSTAAGRAPSPRRQMRTRRGVCHGTAARPLPGGNVFFVSVAVCRRPGQASVGDGVLVVASCKKKKMFGVSLVGRVSWGFIHIYIHIVSMFSQRPAARQSLKSDFSC